MATVMTLMWGDALERYGRVFLTTFDAYWPKEVGLVVTTDRELPIQMPGRIVRQVALDSVSGARDFRKRWADTVVGEGRGHVGGPRDWRHDAVKWAPQGLSPTAMVSDLPDGEVVCWLDADVETFAQVPAGFVERLLGQEDDLVHLGRSRTHSEIGFYALRLNRATRFMLEVFATLYRADEIFSLREQHSAYAFDRACEVAGSRGLRTRSLTTGGGHVWWQTELGCYLDHKKGKRKDRGLSTESIPHREKAKGART